MRRDGRDNTKKIRGFISKVVPSKKGIGKQGKWIKLICIYFLLISCLAISKSFAVLSLV